MQPWTIAVDDADLDDLNQRLRRTRWPEQIGLPWQYGTDMSWLQDLCSYWADGFEWRTQEAALNRLSQFTTDIDGQRLHFVHERAGDDAALAVLLLHGWPGSFVEFMHLIEPMARPATGTPAYHVVCPSLPGYGFSSAPTRPGCNGRACAELFMALMARLGYRRYVVQGGDWGSHIATWMAALDPACVGIHLNLATVPRPRDVADPMAALTDVERQRLAIGAQRVHNGMGYQEIQGTRPQTLGVGLHDSPAGLAAWIGEKFHAWSQHDGDPCQVIPRDHLLTNIALYWFTGTITSSMRLYFENRQHPADPPVPEFVDKPTAVALFPGELYQPPSAWIERRYRLQRYTVQPRGGHFAAMEAPELLLGDLRAFTATLN